MQYPENITLGDKIYYIRKSQGLSQTKFGQMFTPSITSKSIISHWESDANIPRKNRLTQIAKIGHITVNDLISNEVTKDNFEFFQNTYKLKHDTEINQKARRAIDTITANDSEWLMNLKPKNLKLLYNAVTVIKIFETHHDADKLLSLMDSIEAARQNPTDKNCNIAKQSMNQLLETMDKW